ncbi:hypothetical protein V3N99_06655 [Dermatophilaceae bacterium Soc4.6]
MTWPTELDRLLSTDPRDVGCGEALGGLHLYVDLVLLTGAEQAAERYPGLLAHLLACGPCDEDYQGLIHAVGGETARWATDAGEVDPESVDSADG